jgi:hypothetical protein
MSESDYVLNKGKLPAVSIAFKCPIPNMDAALSNQPLFTVDLQSLVHDGEMLFTSTLND